MKSFEDMNLKSELLSSLKGMNFTEPTEVQSKGIPVVLDGGDVIVRSKTGSGKTGAFLVPIVQLLKREDVQGALVIAPTRELASQVAKVAEAMTYNTGLSSTVVYGGASIENQIRSLRRKQNIVIGTPGRIIDLMERGELRLDNIKFLVLDEADIMLDMGFIEDVEYIISKTPKSKQMMLFSATMPDSIVQLSRKYMKKATRITIGNEEDLTVDTIFHSYAVSGDYSKVATLLAYLNEFKPGKSIIFSHTKRGADILYEVLLEHGYDAAVIHGDLTQAQRERSLNDFKKNARYLIATNVAARGLDITDVSDVINFDIPEDPYIYVHRVGRSARMGANGNAMTIINDNEVRLIREIEDSANIRMSMVELNREPFKHVRFHSSRSKRPYKGDGNGERRNSPRNGGRRRSGGYNRGGQSRGGYRRDDRGPQHFRD